MRSASGLRISTRRHGHVPVMNIVQENVRWNPPEAAGRTDLEKGVAKSRMHAYVPGSEVP